MSFNGKEIKGVLCDITGVLTESVSAGGSQPIDGSIDALNRLKKAGIPFRLVTNETQRTRKGIVDNLQKHGFDVPLEDVFPPAIAMATLAKKNNLKPYLLVHPNCLPDFDGIDLSNSDPNCVVLGDAVDGFSYKNLNKAFQTLIKTGGDLYSLGKGKFYREDGDLTLDVGPFTAALEFATEKDAKVVGKPAAEFFLTALNDIGCKTEEAIMIGDDIVSDVGGAQKCGIQGVLVRTGKYRSSDENHPKVNPDKIVDNLKSFVDILLSSQ